MVPFLFALPALLWLAFPSQATASGPSRFSWNASRSRALLAGIGQASPPASPETRSQAIVDTSLEGRAQRAVERLTERMGNDRPSGADSLGSADTTLSPSNEAPTGAGVSSASPGAASSSAAPSSSAADSSANETPGRFDSPTWVMARSLVIPGWGQAKNGAWWKAILVAGIEGALLERLSFEARVSRDFEQKAERFPEASNERARFLSKSEKHAGHRRDFTWWTALFVILSMGDAYVDAHLQRFDVGVQTEDAPGDGAGPANGGEPGDENGGGSGAGAPGIRVGLRLLP